MICCGNEMSHLGYKGNDRYVACHTCYNVRLVPKCGTCCGDRYIGGILLDDGTVTTSETCPTCKGTGERT